MSRHREEAAIGLPKERLNKAAILKLKQKPICLFKIFDFLSLTELLALAQSCKQLNGISAAYFLNNYSSSAVCIDNGIFCQLNGSKYGPPLNAFSKYLKTITIKSLNQINYIKTDCVGSLSELIFVDVMLTSASIKCIKQCLSGIQTVKLIDCKLHGDFYEKFLKYCHHLKSLTLCNVQCKTKDNDWINRVHPKLEQLQLIRFPGGINLHEIFQMFPNIRSLEIEEDFFWLNKMEFVNENNNLDELTIRIRNANNPSTQCIYFSLNSFYKQKYFKRLHLRFVGILTQSIIDQIPNIEALETLHLKGESSSYIPILNNLKELRTFGGNLNMEKTVKNLNNLEKIDFFEANIEHIVLAIRELVRLKEINIRTLNEKGLFNVGFNAKHFYNRGALNLSALNTERESFIIGASKVTIRVDEHIFLATNWAQTDNSHMSHNLIEIKRIMLHDWNARC